MADLIQPSFGKGELGPELHGRVDTTAYQAGLAKASNATIMAQGGATRRPGLRFSGPAKDHTAKGRIIPFRFNTTDTYILEFGNLYMRVLREDGHVIEDTFNITTATQANPVVVTTAAHSYANGDEVLIDGVVGMTELNGRRFTIANVAATTFELTDQVTGDNIDGTAFTAYSSGGTAGRVFTLTTPYTTADLPNLKYTQSADIMTLTHPSYAVRDLTRTDHDAWTLTEATFGPEQTHPTGVTITVDGANNSATWTYRVTALAEDTLEESLSGTGASISGTIISATQANPVVIGMTGHDFLDGDEVLITGVGGMVELNGRRFSVANAGANDFELLNTDGTNFTAFTSGGTGTACFETTIVGTTAPDNTITWTAAAGAQRYAVYREDNGLFGLLGETEELTFKDDNISTDLTISPPRDFNPFVGTGNFPTAVSFFEQRKVFGGSNNNPDTKYYSQTGNHPNFTSSTPSNANDGMIITLNSLEVNQIRHLVPGHDLLVFTSGAEWQINAGTDTGFSADTIRQKPQSYWGASHIRPVVIGNITMYVEEGNAVVRTLGFSLTIDGYEGTDLTVLAPHLFRDYAITDCAFARSPDPIVYFVRADGCVATLTFHQEQQVVAWTTWDTDGEFESVATIKTDHDDKHEATYFMVKRKINGNTVRYIEHVHVNDFQSVKDCFFVDSGLTLDTSFAVSNATAADPVVVTTATHGFSDGDEIDLDDIKWEPDFDDVFNETQPDQLNGQRYFIADTTATTFALLNQNNPIDITGITQADPAVVTAAAHGLSDGDMIGILDVQGMTEANGTTYKVANKTDDTFELNTAGAATVDSSAFTAYTLGGKIYHCEDGTAFNAYSTDGKARKAVLNLTGGRHLAGEALQILADGNVVTGKTMGADGTVTLDRKASRVHLGLRYVTDIETLDIEPPNGTLLARKRKISEVTVVYLRSRGVLIGPSSDRLVEAKWRENEKMSDPTDLLTGKKTTTLKPNWNSNGRIFLRQHNPLPMTILAVIPDVEAGD